MLTQRTIELPADHEPWIAPLVWGLQDTRRRTLRLLESVPEEALDWIPPDGGNTIGTLLYHLVVIEMSYLYEDILEQEWAPGLDRLLPYEIRTEEGRLTPVHGETMATHLERLDEGRSRLLETVRTISREELGRPRRVEEYMITPEWALHHLMQHEAEHRGQISELRRRAVQSKGVEL
jgi:uncharacterized damage-inducible protein DinB